MSTRHFQFTLASLLRLILVSEVGFVMIQGCRRVAPGLLWPVLVGVYYFGFVGILCTIGQGRTLRIIRWGLAGLLVGIIPGVLLAIAEELGGAPDNAVEIGSIVACSTLGLLAGLITGRVHNSNGEKPQ